MIEIKKGSSAWKLGTYWGAETLPNNFCDLIKRVVWCFIVVSLLTSLIGCYLAFLLASIAASFSVGFIVWSTPVIITLSAICIISLLFFVATIQLKIDALAESKGVESFKNTKAIYRSFKDKFCPMVTEK